MFKYIYRRHGHKEETLSQKSAATFLVSEGVPQWAAVRLIELSESRCKMKKQLAEHAGSLVEVFESTITGELHVELHPDPAPGPPISEQQRMF